MRSTTLLSAFLFAAACIEATAAQCELALTSGGPQPKLSGHGRCQTPWDPDGPGPLPTRLVVGGDSLIGGSAPIDQRVMTWDGNQWQALASGPGTAGAVQHLADWNGVLVAAGDFTGGGTDRIASWDGASWQPLGSGSPTSVLALTVWNGTLVAAGFLSGSGGNLATIRTWNGTAWTTLPTPPSLRFAQAAIAYQGLLCVGGSSAAGAGILERWNGTAWLPSITAQNAVYCLGVRPNLMVGGADTLYVGGAFTNIGGVAAAHVASTSGGAAFAWSAVGSGLTDDCLHLHVRNSGLTNFTVVAVFQSSTAPVRRFQSGGAWTTLGNGLAQLTSIGLYTGIYHGTYAASFDDACQRYDGSAWVPVTGPGISGVVLAATHCGDDAIVGGSFQSASGVPMNGIARWDGTALHALGTGVSGPTFASVAALVTLDNGDVIAGGEFSIAGGFTANHVARWSGSAWSALGTGLDGEVLALCTMPNGDVIAGGTFLSAGSVSCAHVARWNGSAWSPLDTGMNGDVRALAVRPDGTLFAGGVFTSASGILCGRVAQWEPSLSLWIPVGSGCNADVNALAARPNGELVASGAFSVAGGSNADRCARWNGLLWLPMNGAPPGRATALLVLPAGDVVAGFGSQFPLAPGEGIARWNGSTWASFGSGLASFRPNGVPIVSALAQRRNGEVIVGGDFAIADGNVSKNLARLVPTCPATAQPYGAGCNSVVGPLVITADTLPWIGAAFRTTTTGVAAGSLCLGTIGFAQLSIPLGSLLAQGQPGCSLLASPDIVTLLPIGVGIAQSVLALANDPALIGGQFFQQTVPLEFDGTGALVAVRGSDALALTIGAL